MNLDYEYRDYIYRGGELSFNEWYAEFYEDEDDDELLVDEA